MWTEQTVETLKKLALEGRSAAWIAEAIGAPSRSAVIGKANRIGIKLNGAPARSGPAAKRSRFNADSRESSWAGAVTVERPRIQRSPPAETPWGRTVSRARARGAAVRQEKRRDRWLFASTEVGEMRRIGLAAIGEAECRWPLGDPTEEDFAFCGLQVARGHAYCAGHCRMVYRTPNG